MVGGVCLCLFLCLFVCLFPPAGYVLNLGNGGNCRRCRKSQRVASYFAFSPWASSCCQSSILVSEHNGTLYLWRLTEQRRPTVRTVYAKWITKTFGGCCCMVSLTGCVCPVLSRCQTSARSINGRIKNELNSERPRPPAKITRKGAL